MGRYDESIAQYQKALEKDPHFTSSYAGIGHNHNYVCKGDYAKAREAKGDKASAAELYKKIAGWNQNDVGYAVVRSRAMARLSQ